MVPLYVVDINGVLGILPWITARLGYDAQVAAFVGIGRECTFLVNIDYLGLLQSEVVLPQLKLDGRVGTLLAYTLSFVGDMAIYPAIRGIEVIVFTAAQKHKHCHSHHQRYNSSFLHNSVSIIDMGSLLI